MSHPIASPRPPDARRPEPADARDRPGREVRLVGSTLPTTDPASRRRIIVRGGRPYRVAACSAADGHDPRRYLHLEPAAPPAR